MDKDGFSPGMSVGGFMVFPGEGEVDGAAGEHHRGEGDAGGAEPEGASLDETDPVDNAMVDGDVTIATTGIATSTALAPVSRGRLPDSWTKTDPEPSR